MVSSRSLDTKITAKGGPGPPWETSHQAFVWLLPLPIIQLLSATVWQRALFLVCHDVMRHIMIYKYVAEMLPLYNLLSSNSVRALAWFKLTVKGYSSDLKLFTICCTSPQKNNAWRQSYILSSKEYFKKIFNCKIHKEVIRSRLYNPQLQYRRPFICKPILLVTLGLLPGEGMVTRIPTT